MKGSPHKIGTIKGSSGHVSVLKTHTSSPIKHRVDGSWRGHKHESLLGKLSGVIAEGIGGIKDRYKDYEANRNKGESQYEYKKRIKKEKADLVTEENYEENQKNIEVKDKVVVKTEKEEIPMIGLNAGGDDWEPSTSGDLTDAQLDEENRIWGERNPDLIKKDILSGELTLQENPWLVNLSFVNNDGTIREPSHDDRWTLETKETGTSEGTEYGIGEWKDFKAYTSKNE